MPPKKTAVKGAKGKVKAHAKEEKKVAKKEKSVDKGNLLTHKYTHPHTIYSVFRVCLRDAKLRFSYRVSCIYKFQNFIFLLQY
jgi:hypothetical protein